MCARRPFAKRDCVWQQSKSLATAPSDGFEETMAIVLDRVWCIYIYIMQISERTSTAPRRPLWTGFRDKTNQKRTITTTHDLRYSCGAAAFARLTYTRHFRIIIIRKSSTVTRGTILLLYSIISRHLLLTDCGVVLEQYIIWEILQL